MHARDLIKILNFYGRFTPSYTRIGYLARGLFLQRYRGKFEGQRWLVTGASGGIGKAIAIAAVKAGAEVVAVARNESKLRAVKDGLPETAKRRFTYAVADMSLQRDTQRLADDLVDGVDRFDVLVNNVGILWNTMATTSEGRETTFATNLLSHYLLTESLVANDKIAADGAVINMTSGGMYNAPLGTENLNVTDASRYNGKAVYAAHKRGQVALTAYWNHKYGSRDIGFYVMHPGWAKTAGVKSALPTFYNVQNLILRSPYQGGETALWLAAIRPSTSDDPDAGVWFDHALRPAHMFDFTRKPRCTVDEFVGYLDTELQQGLAA